MSRISPEVEIKYICNVIDKNIKAHSILKDRGLLAENILSQLRNLIEDVAILVNNKENALTLDSHYDNVEISMQFVSGMKKFKYIKDFHKFLQQTVSHYTPSEGDAERLILYYFRYICMIKNTLETEYGIKVLDYLEDFPIYEDKLTKEHYEKICSQIEQVKEGTNNYLRRGRFYVDKCRPIYANGKLYYEVTLSKATDYANKFERILMYSKQYIPDYYSIKLSYIEREVELFSYKSKIKVIDNYLISIRPCEIKNIGRIFGFNYDITDEYNEYINLMLILKENEVTLLDILLSDEEKYSCYFSQIKEGAKNAKISEILSVIRDHLCNNKKGSNILKYLLVKTENQVIKDQLDNNPNINMAGLYIINRSIPFDSMPYAMSLYKHNISWIHLLKSVDFNGRNHELLGKYIKNNSENNNILYTDRKEVEKFGNLEELIDKYNNAIVANKIDLSGRNKIKMENDFLFIASYETNSINIIEKLNSYKTPLVPELNESFFNNKNKYNIDELSIDKKEILENIFNDYSIALIHGSAGTGKTKMLEVLAIGFKDYSKIFLSNTNTAVENLRRRIEIYDNDNSYFKTVASFNEYDFNNYDILIIDECSTVSNEEMNKILGKNDYKLVILSGDVYQIESIKYGNWFSLAYKIFKNDFVYELINTNRTEDKDLLELWKMVRDNDEQAINKISNKEYSDTINDIEFNSICEDEIVLCLNYDGLYGINNINKLFQEKNPNQLVNIGVDSFKVDDHIVFNDCPRFKSLYNNLKGRIKKIEEDEIDDCIWFTILVDTELSETFDNYDILEHLKGKTLIRFYVNNFKDYNDDLIEYKNEHIIPFNLAYAMSIHKAQGLEYDSVKIVITSNVEEQITKNIFYTAITRTKKYLKIYWSSESQLKIFDQMKKRNNSRDISLLKQKLNI